MNPFELTTLTSVVAALTMLTLIIGYGRALLTASRGPVFHLAASICLVFFAYVARTVYWDILPGPAEFPFKNDMGTSFNTAFDLVAIWGGIHGHIAIYLMIPSVDRKKWSPFTAWLYPPFHINVPFRRMLDWFFLKRR